MEKKSECEHCRTWEEEMYWKNFNCMHFCLILPRNYHDHLVLPEKFAAHMTTQLPDKVSLTGPSGSVWDIELQKTNSLLLVGDGWKDFVKAYDLEENCLLMFKYKRNLGFEVLIFNRKDFCEKEAAYFVKQCRHTKPGHKEHKRRTVREGTSPDIIEDDTEDHSSAPFVSKKSKKNVEEGMVCLGQEKNAGSPIVQPSNAAKRGRGRPRKMIAPCNFRSESMTQTKEMPAPNEAPQEQSQIPVRYMTTPENEESSPEKDRADNLNEKSDPHHEHNVAELNPSGNDTIQNACPISSRGRTIPEDQDDFSDTNHSDKFNSPSGKDPSENGMSENDTVKNPSQNSGRGLIVVDYVENSPEANHTQTPRRKRGRPRKQDCQHTPMPSRKRIYKSVSAGKHYGKEYSSSRRAVTEMEKKDALERASQEQTENSFIVVMRPTCVYRRFYLSIPADWMNKHLPLQHQEIVLRVGDKTWNTVFYYNHKRSVGGLCPGWKNFALENSLEEFDVLLFKLAKKNDDAAIVFDVEIFRVVPDISPPLLVDSSI